MGKEGSPKGNQNPQDNQKPIELTISQLTRRTNELPDILKANERITVFAGKAESRLAYYSNQELIKFLT